MVPHSICALSEFSGGAFLYPPEVEGESFGKGDVIMEKSKNSFIAIGLMLFALFFGANWIFPVFMGRIQVCGNDSRD